MSVFELSLKDYRSVECFATRHTQRDSLLRPSVIILSDETNWHRQLIPQKSWQRP